MPKKGDHHSAESKLKLSEAHKGRKFSSEHRANLAASLRGRKTGSPSAETVQKIKDALTGRKRTPEQIEKNRISHLGQPSARKGVTLSEETKGKIREARAIQGNPKMNLRGITQAQMDEAKANGLRWCAGRCKAFLPLASFYKNGDTKRTVCADCGLSVNRLVGRNSTYGRYGVTEEWYNEQLVRQDGRCALCPAQAPIIDMSEPSTRTRQRYLSIDHDHDTGKVRGLLCGRCNLSLHRVEYVKGWARRAVEYLEAHGSAVGKQAALVITEIGDSKIDGMVNSSAGTQ